MRTVIDIIDKILDQHSNNRGKLKYEIKFAIAVEMAKILECITLKKQYNPQETNEYNWIINKIYRYHNRGMDRHKFRFFNDLKLKNDLNKKIVYDTLNEGLKKNKEDYMFDFRYRKGVIAVEISL